MKIVSWNLFHRMAACAEEITDVVNQEAPDLVLMPEVTSRIQTVSLLP